MHPSFAAAWSSYFAGSLSLGKHSRSEGPSAHCLSDTVRPTDLSDWSHSGAAENDSSDFELDQLLLEISTAS